LADDAQGAARYLAGSFDRARLLQALTQSFGEADLRTLSFELGIDYDDLPPGGRVDKARELILLCEHTRRIPELLAICQEHRPHLDWSAIVQVKTGFEPPFKGLRYFGEEDADIFFGREQMTADLVSHLGNHRFLAVVGASGSGKSSVVRAGVVPAARRGEVALDGQSSDLWPIHVITPGDEPLKVLAASLTRDAESVTAMRTLIADMQSDRESLDLWLYRQLVDKGPSRLLLVVDQFEELFTQCDDLKTRQCFIENLVQAVRSGKQGRLALVVTLRADFYAHALQYEPLRPLLETRQKIVGSMSSGELRRAIEGPAEAGGWRFQSGLVETILGDLGVGESRPPEPGALPLLSHALLATWQRREGKVMTLAGYQAVGGVRRAIATTADAVFTDLNPEQQFMARSIFLRLTELGDGTGETRRRAKLDELVPRTDRAREIQAVLQILTDRRLITTTGDSAEVAHEALIREWPTLRNWLDEDRVGLRIHRELTEAAQAWVGLNRDPGALYRGLRLVRAETWIAERDAQLSELEKSFLEESRAALLAEEEARRKERQRALRMPLFTLLGGAVGYSFSFLLASSPTVQNPSLLLVLTLLRLSVGGLSGFFLILLADMAAGETLAEKRRMSWLLGGLGGSGSFAFLLYFDALLGQSALGPGLLSAAAQGALWGFPAGLGRVWMLRSKRPWWQTVPSIAVICGIVLMLADQLGLASGGSPALIALLAGSIMPSAVLLAAHLADPDKVRYET
jgi:energy-coupling factor transporter ATP-binding protein EcfA2